MPRLERLLIHNYRGASVQFILEFDSSKPIALVFGENGTGKSTITDAIDAIGNGSKGSLEDRSSTRARDHLPTIGKKAADVRIELTAGGNAWVGTLSGDNLTTNPLPRPRVRVLRRKHLRLLVEAPPSQRYEALRHFINVEKAERSENALREAATEANAALDDAARLRVETDTQLQRVWEAEGKPGASASEWAKAVAAEQTEQLDLQARQLRTAQHAISSSQEAIERYRESVAAASTIEHDVHLLETEVESLPGVDAQQAMSLAGVLRQVAQHIESCPPEDKCPVCRQDIPSATLKAEIAGRLLDLTKHDDLRHRREVAQRKLLAAKDSVVARQTTAIASARELLKVVQTGKVSILSAGITLADYPQLAQSTSADLAKANLEAEGLVKAAGPFKQELADTEIKITKRSGQINSLRELHEQIQAGVAEAEQLQRLKLGLDAAHDVARLSRIAFTQEILDEVANECNRLYGLVHPNEPLAISKLELDVGRRASLNQAATFEGFKDVPPQAYFSDSHLDTLGFCFWLATAKRESLAPDTVIVMDDIFTSVDAKHIGRIAQLITDESKHFAQVIITTHQRLWRDLYRYQHSAGKLVNLIELQRWTLAKGISNYKTRLAVQELAAALAASPFDRQASASKAGVLLEASLDYLALQYRSRVARTPDGAYTLGELLDATESLFKKLEVHRPAGGSSGASPHTVESTVGIVVQLRGLAFLRNQVGAHFNVAGAEISDADVQTFADLTVKLAQALSCKVCGQIPGKSSGSHFRCSCVVPNDTRLLPLQLP